MAHFLFLSLTLWLWYSQSIIKQSLSLLVMRMLMTLSGWSLSLLLIDTGVMLLVHWFTHIAGELVEQLVHCPLTLVVTDSTL